MAVLLYPYVQRGLLSPATAVTQPICRQIRFLSAYFEGQDMPAMFFLVDRYTKSNWLALRTNGDQYLWSEIGYSAVGIQETVAQVMQEANLPPVVQGTIASMMGLITSPRLPQVALLSPVMQDCSPEDQNALEHVFAREDLRPSSSYELPDEVPLADLSVDAMETDQDKTTAGNLQEAVVVHLGTVIPENGANVRSGPGIGYEIVASVPQGHLVAYVSESEDGEWVHLVNGNWMFASLLSSSFDDALAENSGEANLALPEPTSMPSPANGPASPSTPQPVLTEQADLVEMAALRQQALIHVNNARALSGLSPVRLGDNAAAQTHADEMAENQFLSHWNLAGLTPDMRYTLAGGEAYSAENVAFIGNIIGPECIPL